MDLDDSPIGRVLTRREAVAALAASGGLLLLGSRRGAGASAPAQSRHLCVVRPKSTPGPYYVDEKLDRSDIRSDPTDGTVKPGALLTLTLALSTLGKSGCSPLKDAIVDIWQCDAEGVYSDAKDPRAKNRFAPVGSTSRSEFSPTITISDPPPSAIRR